MTVAFARGLRVAGVVGAAVAVAFAGVTVWALEGRDVVVVRTVSAEGEPRETRTWIADEEGYAWVEAANPDRPFLRDLTARPQVEVQRHGRVAHCVADATPNPAGHARIRRLLSAKYGWADTWIGCLTDTSGSIAVRLRCD
jgi:hypothetical protein